ncbi:hypothetical protein [Serratia sp. M24T3]|uniref:DUF2846 domain-containing protein n=1 Tax=Rouxiella sp. WC2420 TaxID=3234145 RepID=A0AB39VLN3_9GAMM|nr:hypothetical protein SPM24T3_06208 [Serratia sp. M24T3]
MRKFILVCAALVLAGCSAGPYEPTQQVLQAYASQKPGTTKIRVHRQPQIAGSILDESCPLIVYMDNKEVAGLQKNQYADLYVPNGTHSLKVKFSCAITPLDKAMTIQLDGTPQTYETGLNSAQRYSLTRVN